MMKLVPEQVDNIRRGDAAAYNPDALTPESHWSSASPSLKQLIAATLRSGDPRPEHINKTISHHQNTAAAGQCVNNMDLGPPDNDQDVQVISGESNYWQTWEEEVLFNSGRTHTRELTPQFPNETIDEMTG